MKLTSMVFLAFMVPWLFLSGCHKEKPHTELDQANVLIVTLDTTRADRLGCYGYAQAQTPTLDALAAQGALFEDAQSVVPLTQPSHTTIMTGRYPRETGVRVNGEDTLSDKFPTLATLFRKKGYKTGAFVSSFVLDHQYGLDRGFDVYDDEVEIKSGGSINIQESERPADVVTARALKWLDANADKPFFCWIHYYDPHGPYAPPPKFRERLADPYDGEIAFVDSEFSMVLDWLKSRRLLDHTLIVIAGDHGESFGEHGELGHTTFLYETNLHVPLIVANSHAVKACRVKGMVSLIDVFPTILELCGISEPDGLLGRSLAAALAGESPEHRSGYAESDSAYDSFGWAQQRAILTDAWKFVSSTKPELFDRKLDPKESHNLAVEKPDVVKSMRKELDRIYARMTPNAPIRIAQSQETMKRLESLGYVSSGGASQTDELLTQGLLDPKDMVDLVKELQEGNRLFEERHFAEALAILEKAVQRSPNSVEILLRLGRVYSGTDRNREAIETLKKAVQLDSSNLKVLRALGNEYMHVRQYSEAIEYYKLLLEQSPDDRFALDSLGSAYLEAKQTDKAIASFRKALELKPDYGDALIHLGSALIDNGASDDAEKALQKAMADSKTEAQAHYLLGHIASGQDKKEIAIQHLEKAVAISPGYEQAVESLTKYYLFNGRTPDAIRILRRALAESPGNVRQTLSLAEILATSKHEELRNGEEAVRIVEPVLPHVKGTRGLVVLAEAKAEVADFDSATALAEKALATEESAGNEKLVSFIKMQLDSYRAKQPYRNPSF